MLLSPRGKGYNNTQKPNARSSKSTSSGRIRPRSASRRYVVKKKKSPYSSFRPKKAWEKAYEGDIAGKPFRSKSGTTLERIIQNPRPVRSISMMRGESRAYQGNIRSDKRKLSATRPSEQSWKNSISKHKLRLPMNRGPGFLAGQYIPRKKRGDQPYNGNIKSQNFSISRRGEVAGRKILEKKSPGAGTLKGIVFKGNIKAGRRIKGGGSINRNGWNNNGKSLTKLKYSEQIKQTAAFQGNIKAGSPIKGGGSINRNGWNNNGKSLTKLKYSEQIKQTAAFQGNIKAGSPIKGGGSINRNGWNNNGRSLTKPKYTEQIKQIAAFQGDIKAGKPIKGGGSVSRNGWNNHGKPITKLKYTEQIKEIAGFQGNIKVSWDYKKNPSAAKGALVTIAPSKVASKSTAFEGKSKSTREYKKNPSSAKGALKSIARSNVAIKVSNYQGNIKMNKSKINDAHPSYRYLREQNSSTHAKDKNFNLKLLFAKIFKKNEAQPTYITEKEKAPRFDRRERNIWYD